jgi:hypothetical protein
MGIILRTTVIRSVGAYEAIHRSVVKDVSSSPLTGEGCINRIQAIRVFAVRVTPIFTNRKHAINTLKMTPLLRSDVMQS